jgi:hypothetical protein
MTTYALPTTVSPTAMEFGLIANTWRFTSPYTGHSQTLGMPGARWSVVLQWEWLKASEAGTYEAFLAKLKGGEHYFTTYNWFRSVPTGTMRGTLTVATSNIAAGATSGAITGGSGQAGTSLNFGDYISINGELKIVTGPNVADGSGVISITFDPPMRATATVGASVVWDRPTATFRQNENATRWQYQRALARNFVLAGEEVY